MSARRCQAPKAAGKPCGKESESHWTNNGRLTSLCAGCRKQLVGLSEEERAAPPEERQLALFGAPPSKAGRAKGGACVAP